jgi:hypothetical protein
MSGRGDGAIPRVHWAPRPTEVEVARRLAERRWRILRMLVPAGCEIDPLPLWLETPEQFVRWLSARLSRNAGRAYFLDLERVAKQTCDLELLRLARRHRRHR